MKKYCSTISRCRFPVVCGAVTVSLIASSCAADLSGAAKKRSNEIFIIADDLGYGDLSYNGNPVLKTPNIDKLAASAVNLTNYHVHPYSTPTRAVILTGMYPHRTGARKTTSTRGYIYSNIPTLGNYFKVGGCSTALFGKWPVEFVKSGIYSFEFCRWPRCLNAGLTESVTVEPDKNNYLYDLLVYLSSFGGERNRTAKGKRL